MTDLKIVDYDFQQDPTPSAETIPSQNLNPSNTYRLYTFKLLLNLIHHWKGLDWEITHFDYHHDRTPSAGTIPSQSSNFKHVGIINVSDKPTYDRSVERS